MAVVEQKLAEKKFEQILSLSDLADPKLPVGSASKLDVDADAYEVPMPPAKGRYDLRVGLSEKDAIKLRRTDDKDPNTSYYSIGLECRIVSDDPATNNRVVYSYISSRMNRGQKISTLAFVLMKCGFSADKLKDKEFDQLTLVKGLVKWLSVERIVRGCLIDWEGYSKEQSKTIFRSMDHFPVDDDGTHEHIVTITTPGGGMEDITAKLVIKDWGGKEENGVAGPVAAIPVRAKVAAPVETADDDDASQTVQVPAKAAPIASAPVAGAKKKGMPPLPPVAATENEDDEDLDELFS